MCRIWHCHLEVSRALVVRWSCGVRAVLWRDVRGGHQPCLGVRSLPMLPVIRAAAVWIESRARCAYRAVV